jgi:hypothetical protein
MENINNDFAENIADAVFEIEQSNFYLPDINSPGPGDDDDEEGDDDADKDKDKSKSSNDDDPPLDEDVVHSPLTTQDGGKP